MNMKEKRVEKGLTQFDMAKLVGVSVVSYRMWEHGVSTPNEENMQKLKKVLEIPEQPKGCSHGQTS